MVSDHEARYHSEWPIRVNVEHILSDEMNWQRLPESIRNYAGLNLYLLIEVAVEMTRRYTEIAPGIIVPQIYQGRLQYLLPLYLTKTDRIDRAEPDLALTLSPMPEGYYCGHTCLTLEMAMQNARLFARPTARWLTDILDELDDEQTRDEMELALEGMSM